MGRQSPVRLRLIVAVNAIAAALAAAALLVVLTRPLGPPDEPTLEILDEDQLRDQAARTGLAEGQIAPGVGDGSPLALSDLEEQPMDLARLRGRPVWIVFWATYCHACREEEQDLRRAYAAHRDDGLVLLAIDAGEPADEVRRYVEERQLPWQIALDPELRASDAYGAIGTPTHYFIGRDGLIAARAFGRLELAEMEAYVGQIVGR